MTKEQAMAILAQVARAIVETIEETGPTGTPGGLLYAALMNTGLSLDGFEQIMAGLVDAGRINRRGDLYYPA